MSGQLERFHEAMRKFVFTELDTGIAFASLALDSTSSERRQRALENARKAYDTAARFRKKLPSQEAAVQEQLVSRTAELRGLLFRLSRNSPGATP